MKLQGKRILLTGAGGGIGSALAEALIAEGACVLLAGRDLATLQALATRLDAGRKLTAALVADLSIPGERARLSAYAMQWQGGIDMLINNAGVSDFGLLESQSGEALQNAITTNLLAPMDLCRQLLPHFKRRPQAHIVNIGSVFGNIGFAGNAAYCATKFGLRGFSEALRRELADGGVSVHYFAPRATCTTINSSAVDALNQALGNAVDDPADVARQIVNALRADRSELVFGWPEKLFARINAVLPRLVDKSLFKQLPVIRNHARRGVAAERPQPARIAQPARNAT